MQLLVNATSITLDSLTGIERFALRITQELCRIDESVQVLSTEEIPEVHALKTPVLAAAKRVLHRREYLLRALWDQTAFRWQVSKNRPDLVFFPIQDGMLCPPVKQIVTVHDLHYLHFSHSVAECREEIGRVRTSLYRRKMPHILSRSAAVVAVSDSTKKDLVEHFHVPPDKVHVIYNGYDEERFHAVAEPDAVLQRYGLTSGDYFLFVGSILKHKNLVRLVQSFGLAGGKARLVIAGACKDPTHLGEVMEAAGELGLTERVRYLEFVPDEDLPSLYNGAAAFVLPSLHEGFGVPLIEAMACGAPVITSNCSAMPEVAGEAALYVDPGSVESIAFAMTQIASIPELSTDLRNKGLKRARRYSWSRSAMTLYELCEEISRR